MVTWLEAAPKQALPPALAEAVPALMQWLTTGLEIIADLQPRLMRCGEVGAAQVRKEGVQVGQQQQL